jgi:hypothetical protein
MNRIYRNGFLTWSARMKLTCFHTFGARAFGVSLAWRAFPCAERGLIPC